MLLDKFQKINLKNKIIASSAGFLLALFGLIYFIVIPTTQDIKAMGRGIEEQRIDLEKKYNKSHSLRQLTENLKKIQPKLSSLDEIFIDKNKELDFITTLENEANSAQVSQKINLNPPQATENQEFQKSLTQLYTKGGFSRQLQYLLNLEALRYYINIKTLELSPAGAASDFAAGSQGAQTGQTNSINLVLNADTYWK